MIRIPPVRQRTRWIAAAVVGVLVLLGAMILPSIPPGRPSPRENLQHFEGALDYSKRAHDQVQSELYVRAGRALGAGDVRSAETIYRGLIAEYPRDPDGYGGLGACLLFQARYEEARREYLHAVELDSQSVDALYGLGSVAYEQDRSGEARDYLEKALALDQKNGLCHRLLGLVYEDLGDLPKATLHYERAVALDPSVAEDAVIRERLKKLKR